MTGGTVREAARYWWDTASMITPAAQGGTVEQWLPRVLNAAVTEIMAAAPDAPAGRLLWDIYSSGALEGQVTCDDDDQAGDVAQEWAAYLGLTPSAGPGPGTVEYSGRVGSRRVFVWAVTDRDAFGQDTGAGGAGRWLTASRSGPRIRSSTRWLSDWLRRPRPAGAACSPKSWTALLTTRGR